jgi:small conductance mechanosensitive channel
MSAWSETLLERQDSLQLQLDELTAAHKHDRPFLEDILKRKNTSYRDALLKQIKTMSDYKKATLLLTAQASFLDGLIEYSDDDLQALSKELRANSFENSVELQLMMQRRIRTMDTYYQQLYVTLITAAELSVDLRTQTLAFTLNLSERAEYLSNTILYLDTRKKEAETRLAYVDDASKEAINQQLVRFKEQVSMSAKSLESTIGILAALDTDVTDYKQLLLTITGDINAGVLDASVAYGLFEKWLASFKAWAFENTPSFMVKALFFLFILYVTRTLSRIVSSGVRKSAQHSKMKFSVLMQDFFVSIASKAVIFVGILFAASQIGIELAPLLTGFGVAGVIIGFALQDTLSNFASGLMILIYRPYDVGDMVKVAGIQGTVKNMSLVSTSIQTIDNQRLVIPNNKIWGDVINNITAEKIRRVDMVFGIGYADDIDAAREVFKNILASDSRVLKTPESTVKLHTLNESSVDFVVRPWVKTEDYWDVYWDVTEQVKKNLDNANISIPFPQRDIHIYKHDHKEE